MKPIHMLAFCVFLLMISTAVIAQQPAATADQEVTVPNLIKFTGTLKDPNGLPRVGTIEIKFGLYASQEGGDPLWNETQLVQTDAEGNYSIYLGASEKMGLPLDLFSSQKARWLGVQAEGEVKQARVVLVAVPYALKAADADTVAGQSTSSFVLNEDWLEAGGDFNTYRGILLQRGIIGADGKLVAQRILSRLTGGGILIPNHGGGPLFPLTTQQDSNVTSFGYNAGTAGDGVSFLGAYAGSSNTGYSNSFFGNNAGQNNTTGNGNSVLGAGSGLSNTAENNNSFIGASSDGVAGITNATAVGYRAKVTQSNSLVLGSINGVNGATADTNVGIGITAPAVRLDVAGGMRISPRNENEAGLLLSNQSTPSVWQFATYNSGKFYIQEADVGPRMVFVPTTGNVGIGTSAPSQKLEISGNVKASGIVFPDASSLTSATAARTRAITYLAGCDTCSALTDTDDQRTIYFNLVGPMTINSVTCFSDAGTPTVNLRHDSGTASNVLASDLTCSTTGTASTSIVPAQSILNLTDKLDFVMVSAGGVAKRVTIAIKATVN